MSCGSRTRTPATALRRAWWRSGRVPASSAARRRCSARRWQGTAGWRRTAAASPAGTSVPSSRSAAACSSPSASRSTGSDSTRTDGYGSDDDSVLSNWEGYGENILAVADGTVVRAIDGLPNQVPGALPQGLNPLQADGNAVFLRLRDGRIVMYAHMIPGFGDRAGGRPRRTRPDPRQTRQLRQQLGAAPPPPRRRPRRDLRRQRPALRLLALPGDGRGSPRPTRSTTPRRPARPSGSGRCAQARGATGSRSTRSSSRGPTEACNPHLPAVRRARRASQLRSRREPRHARNRAEPPASLRLRRHPLIDPPTCCTSCESRTCC